MIFKLHKQAITLLSTISLIILSGCASIVSKSNYPISISSKPSGAEITVTNQKGTDIYIGNTPANLSLKASAGFFSKASYTVTFRMNGYQEKKVPINFKIDGWYFGNILFGGLIGILIVDPATGAMWKLNTEFVNETLTSISADTKEPSLKVLGYNDIPNNWKKNLEKID